MRRSSRLVAMLVIVSCYVLTTIGIAQPSPRGYVDMAYDRESELVVLFGGQNTTPSDVNGETWVFDPATAAWEQRFPDPSPPARGAHAIVYDAHSDRVVLFSGGGGGADLVQLTDLWSYDANTDTWTRHESESDDVPPGRVGGRMVYDAESDRIVLFGGLDWSRRQSLADTWSLDLDTVTWTEVVSDPSPPQRNFHQMAYHHGSDRVFLWGGDIRPFSDWGVLWSFDLNSNTWTSHEKTDRPISVYYGELVSLPGDERLLLYGGGPTGSDATWLYEPSTETWTEVESDGPGVRSRFALAAAGDGAYLFGGQLGATNYEYENDLWRFDPESLEWERP